MRENMFDTIPGRDHRAMRWFPFSDGGDEQEFMVYGIATYKHHDDAEKDTEWAGRVIVRKDPDGKVKLALVHVFLVLHPPISHALDIWEAY